MHSRSEKPQGLQGILQSLSAEVQKKAAHKSLKRGFKYDMTLHPFESSEVGSASVTRGGSTLRQDYVLPGVLRAEDQFPYNLANIRMSWLLKQWECSVFYLFFRADTRRPQAGTAFLNIQFIFHMTTCCLYANLYEAEKSVFPKLCFAFDFLYLAAVCFLGCLQSWWSAEQRA